MSMPIAPMHEYHCFEFSQGDVRVTKQIIAMKPEAIAQTMKEPSDLEFWLGVLAPDS